jgi:hypothetical protein
MKKLLLVLVFAMVCTATQAQLYINELLASNTLTITDDNGDFDDWIEIYNAGSLPVDLAGYYLTDDAADMVKYQIPTGSPLLTTVAAHGFLLIWCDDEGAQGPLHTNFKLGAGGEFVGISDANQTVLDSLTFGAQNPDISYGRTADGGPNWSLFATPTPEATNVIVGLDPQAVFAQYFLYPNPTTSKVQSSDHQAFTIFDVSGRQVGSADANGTADVSGLPAGIYIARGFQGPAVRFTKR